LPPSLVGDINWRATLPHLLEQVEAS
jgi:hypothetical protein